MGVRYHILRLDARIADNIKRIRMYYSGKSEEGIEAWGYFAHDSDTYSDFLHILVNETALSEADIICLTLTGHYVKLMHSDNMSDYLRSSIEDAGL